MSYAYVGNGFNTANAASISYAMASASNIAIIAVETSNGAGNPYILTALTNNGGQLKPVFGTYGSSADVVSGGPDFGKISYWYYAPGTDASAPTSFVFTFNGGTPGNCTLALVEYSGIATGTPLIGTVGSVNAQTNPGTGANAVTSGTQSVGTVPALVLGISVTTTGSSYTAGTGYTQRVNLSSGSGSWSFEDLRATSAGNQTATWTESHGASASYWSMLLAFAEPAGGPSQAMSSVTGSSLATRF